MKMESINSYDGPLMNGWEPGVDRNVRNYIGDIEKNLVTG